MRQFQGEIARGSIIRPKCAKPMWTGIVVDILIGPKYGTLLGEGAYMFGAMNKRFQVHMDPLLVGHKEAVPPHLSSYWACGKCALYDWNSRSNFKHLGRIEL